MLVLTRRLDEKLKIGDNIVITVVQIQKGTVQLGIEAPKDVNISREKKIREDKGGTSDSRRNNFFCKDTKTNRRLVGIL